MDEQRFRNIPNLISGLRILLLPVFVALCLHASTLAESGSDPRPFQWFAMSTLVLIGVSDVVDGFLARRMGWVTPLGKVLDPLADKLAQVTGLTLFSLFVDPPFERIPLVLLIVLLARDIVLLMGSLLIARARKLEVKPGWFGKLATLLTFSLLILVSGGLFSSLIAGLTYCAATLVVLSAIMYVKHGIRQWRDLDPSSGT